MKIKSSLQHFRYINERGQLRKEIKNYKEILRSYQINVMELPVLVPKQEDIRQKGKKAALVLANNKNLRNLLLEKKVLPMKELIKEVAIKKRTIELHQKYILALALLLIEDYQYLQNYLKIF